MKAISRKKRTLADLSQSVAAGVLKAIQLLEKRYGATEFHESGHNPDRRAPVLVVKLPRYDNAEVGVPLNKRDITLYMRDRTCDGKRLRDLISADKVTKVYPRDGNPSASIEDSPYLRPSATNEVLKLKLVPEDVDSVLAAFFGDSGEGLATIHAPSGSALAPIESRKGIRSGLTEEDFAAILERQSEVGRAGEMLVIKDELARLKNRGCPDPERYVHRVAASDVGRGYDIESSLPGEERCIEVKSTTRPGSDFFLTANERSVLAELGERAWLYRVVLDGQGNGKIEKRMRNPAKRIADEQMTPVIWRVSDSALLSDE